ncbi:hypothetical protein FJTKL_08381 [Diaporthe vaccinii]|uniref:Uncharacterized protein n=1 Tax=Diaporthe vaccinii TaxID=105482 RepID=A0ABR4ERS8_9PEZI
MVSRGRKYKNTNTVTDCLTKQICGPIYLGVDVTEVMRFHRLLKFLPPGEGISCNLGLSHRSAPAATMKASLLPVSRIMSMSWPGVPTETLA